jgi:CheY-like chemotaxis protein
MTAAPINDRYDLLLVRSDPVEGILFASALEGFGCMVHTAETEQEAIRSCELFVPDILVMNLPLADVDGFFTIAKLRSAVGPDTPIIALSPYDDSVVRAQALRVGATFCLVKHYDLNPLKEFIVGLLGLCRRPVAPWDVEDSNASKQESRREENNSSTRRSPD